MIHSIRDLNFSLSLLSSTLFHSRDIKVVVVIFFKIALSGWAWVFNKDKCFLGDIHFDLLWYDEKECLVAEIHFYPLRKFSSKISSHARKSFESTFKMIERVILQFRIYTSIFGVFKLDQNDFFACDEILDEKLPTYKVVQSDSTSHV